MTSTITTTRYACDVYTDEEWKVRIMQCYKRMEEARLRGGYDVFKLKETKIMEEK